MGDLSRERLGRGRDLPEAMTNLGSSLGELETWFLALGRHAWAENLPERVLRA
jgi:hypothetical protein